MIFKTDIGDIDNLFYVLEKTVNQGFLQFDKDGLSISVPDPSGVTVIKLRLEADFFDNYNFNIEDYQDYEVEGKAFVGAYLSNFKPVLDALGSGKVEYDIKDGRHVFKTENSKTTLPILELDFDDYLMEVDHLDLPTNFRIDANKFVDVFKKLKLVEQPVDITMLGSEIKFFSESNTADVEIDVTGKSFNRESKDVYTSKFSHKQKKQIHRNFKKLKNSDDTLKINMGNNQPIEIILESENMKYMEVVAPRIPE